MTYTIVSNPDVEVTFRKMGKKDSTMFEQQVKKLMKLAENQGDWENHCDLLYKVSGACMLDLMSFYIKSIRN